MLQLNLGSGTNRKQDYISVDLYTEADLIINIVRPLPFDDETVDNIYASHVIEHFTREEWDSMHTDWVRVLKPGGSIEIRCPDIIKSCEKLIENPYDPFNMMILYGGQHAEGEYHKNGFTQRSLTDSFPSLTARLLEPSTDYELHMKFKKERA